jgi:hypothetical protein
MALLLLDDLNELDRNELKKLITTEASVLAEDEIRSIHARRDYLSSKILSLFKSRFEELDLYGYERNIKEAEFTEKKIAKK